MYGACRRKPAVKQNVSCRNSRIFSCFQKFQHGMRSFFHGKHAAFITYGSFVNGKCLVYPVFLVFGRKKDTVNRKRSAPPAHPNVSKRNPDLYVCPAWSYTLARSSTFLERLRLYMESSMIRTLARFYEPRGTNASLIILPERTVVKRLQLICTIFMKRYTTSFAKAGVFLPEIRFMYMLLFETSDLESIRNLVKATELLEMPGVVKKDKK